MSSDSSDNYVPIREAKAHVELFELQEMFSREFQKLPTFLTCVPGRVNIIGEHIDYCGYPVLPMALEQNILLAVAPSNDSLLHLKNTDPKYKSFKCHINNIRIELPETGRPLWHNYFLCGIKGVLEHFELDGNLDNGMMIIVSGNLPSCAGLSSSSALVSSAALCTAYINHLDLDKQKLAEIAAKCERYIGTIGGGMDQAIAFLARSGCAQFIEWNPLRATSVNLPHGAIFVIANSLAEANKAATSDFNQRVIECRLGCKLLAKQMGLTNWKEVEKYSYLQKILECDLIEVEQFIDQYLNLDLYSKDTLLDLFDIGEDEFREDLLTPNTRNAKTFKLRQRGLHVIQETIRVYRFKEIAENGTDLQELSSLMRRSHESLKTLYECSHPNLDKLIEISDEIGVGARLTGAGWGGCIVALCDTKSKCLDYIAAIKERYYMNLPQAKGRNFDELVFATSPQQGAQIYLNEII